MPILLLFKQKGKNKKGKCWWKTKKGTHIYWVPRGCQASKNTNNKNRLRTEYLRVKERMFSAPWLHLTQHILINTTPPNSTGNGIECELSVPSFTLTITRVLVKVIFISLNKSIITVHQWGFPDGTSGKEPTCQCRRHKRFRFNPWVGKTPLEEDTAPHSSILDRRISWTEEPGGLQSIGSRRVGCDWSAKHSSACIHPWGKQTQRS